MSDYGTIDEWIGHLGSVHPTWRKQAALVLGDWLYPRGGLSDQEMQRMHQALLDAALTEPDEDVLSIHLRSLMWSERPMPGVTGWDRLIDAAPQMPYEAQELALAILSVSGEPAYADRLETLVGKHPDFDHALVRKTIADIRRSTKPD